MLSLNRTSRSAKRGFTLIELLVVIAIISLLAAILFPVFGRARENARRTACLSNMKQIGLAMRQYVQDYDGIYPLQQGPSIPNFMSPVIPEQKMNLLLQLVPYVRNPQCYICPSAVKYPDASSGIQPTALSATSYLTNGVVLHLHDGANYFQKPINEAVITQSADIIMMQEFAWNTNSMLMRPRPNAPVSGVYAYDYWHATGSYGTVACPNNECFSNMHFDGGNILFCDGHAKWRKYVSLSAGEFGLTPDDDYSTNSGAFRNGSTTLKYNAQSQYQ